MRSAEPSPLKLRFNLIAKDSLANITKHLIDNSPAAHYAQKFTLQRKNLDPLFEPVLVSHRFKDVLFPVPFPVSSNKQFRAASLPRQRANPYTETTFAFERHSDASISRKRSAFIMAQDLFQVEMTKPPPKNRPRRLKPVEW